MDSYQFSMDLMLFSADERAVLVGFQREGGDEDFLQRMAAARRRTVKRAMSDAATDADRRLLVGARLPRDLAEKYRACAAENGMSLYRFVCAALDWQYHLLTTPPPGTNE